MKLSDLEGLPVGALEQLLVKAEQEVVQIRTMLESKRRSCSHDWTEAQYNPIVREAYQDHGDPPGTMGVDWRGPMYVPRQETARWTRDCRKCGLKQNTQNAKDDIRKVPVF